MVLADKNKVDDFIKEYIIINSRIKIAKAKIRHAEYNNNSFTVNKQKNNQVYLKITNPKSEQHFKRILTMQRKLLLKLLNFEKE